MLRSVEFNGEAGFLAEEIQSVGSGRMLSPELVGTEPTIPQPAPENLFRPSGVLAKRSGLVGHVGSVEKCTEIRKNGVTPALTPALSPRRGGAKGASRIVRSSLSAFVSLRNCCRTVAGFERGALRPSFQEHSIRVPSPGGEGQGEGGQSLQSFSFL